MREEAISAAATKGTRPMRTQIETMLAAVLGIMEATLLSLPVTALADTPVAESAALAYAVDTLSVPRAVKTASDRDEIAGGTFKVAWRAGETVTVTAPNGVTTTLVSDAASAGTATLVLNAGGCWTLARTGQGMSHDSAKITVRHSLDGTLGDGTVASPAKLVDGDELIDYGAGENYVFTLDSVDGLLSRLVLPTGYCLKDAGDGVWKLVASVDGSQYSCANVVYRANSAQEGPDRTTTRSDALPVAYSGDNWIGDAAKAAKVVFTSPSGTETTFNLTGTGAQSFNFNSPGTWTVKLTMADGTIYTANIDVSNGLTIVFY